MNSKAKEMLRFLEKENPVIEDRISSGIENNRKGLAKIEIKDSCGQPLDAATLDIKQLTHGFYFGCNAFMLEQFPEKEQNRQFEEFFSNLFNLAVVPFYWSDIEPEDGTLRFRKDTDFLYRRPQPDLVLEFCEKYGITPKGHPLLWHYFRPEWLTQDKQEMTKRIRQRFEEISENYGDKIKIWDVCNEAQNMPFETPENILPDNHVELAFKLAEEYFPDCAKIYNDDRIWYLYSKTYTPVYLFMKYLLDNGYKVDELGMQFHMFDHVLHEVDKFLDPEALFKCMDLYASLGLSLNFSEISIRSSRDLGDGDEFQRIVCEKLYRLWFSHEAVNGITWWNMVDGTAGYAPIGTEEGENSIRAGLVNYNMTPKPAYNALERLIKKEWQTNLRMDYSKNNLNEFKGFYGKYEITISTDSGCFKKNIELKKGGQSDFVLTL